MVTILSKPLSLPYVPSVPAGVNTYPAVDVENYNIVSDGTGFIDHFEMDRQEDETLFTRSPFEPFNSAGRDHALRAASAFARYQKSGIQDNPLKAGQRHACAMDCYTVLKCPTGLKPLLTKIDSEFAHAQMRDFRYLADNYSGRVESIPFLVSYLNDFILVNCIQLHERYATNKGFEAKCSYHPILIAANLLALKDDYDVFIPIASKGLFSGAMADLLGLKTIVVEIHAHKRKVPEIRWVDNVRLEDLAGKRILLLDDDITTGATIREAKKLLRPFKPARVDVLLNLVLGLGSPGFSSDVVSNIETRGTKVMYPGNAPRHDIKTTFDILDDLLETPRGRTRRALERFHREFLPFAAYLDGEFAQKVWMHFNARMEFLESLNPMLDGYDDVHKRNLTEIELIFREARQTLVFFAQRIMDRDHAIRQLSAIFLSQNFLIKVAEELIHARYVGRGRKIAEKFEIENEHLSHDHLASFEAAVRAAKEGYDFALIVGPEGFAYAPMFLDLGIPIEVVNIPESTGSARSFKAYFNMRKLKGKRVLIVEDDVHTGLTLQKLLERMNKNMPRTLDLYLGSSPHHQWQYNIPKALGKVFMPKAGAELDVAANAKIFLDHLQDREFLFQQAPLGLYSILK